MLSNKLRQKIRMKRLNATKEGLGFLLSEEDIQNLLKQAGITEEDWKLTGYQLARLNDTGDYVLGNCRFIPYTENYKERKVSPSSREASRRNITIHNSSLTEEQRLEKARRSGYSRRGKRCGGRGGSNKLSDREFVRRFHLVNHLNWKAEGKSLRNTIKQASLVLGCSGTHIRRLLKRWMAIGLI